MTKAPNSNFDAAASEEISERRVAANGLSFRVLEAGSGNDLALCLHGFPECAHSWLGQLPALAGQGFRAWAPDLRGYGQTTRPPAREDYALEKLLADVDGLIENAGAYGRTTLIGHDWGAIIAWLYATRRPGALVRLATMNVPHPGCFKRQFSLRQFARSWYAIAFQVPGLVERVLGEDGRWVRRMFERTSSRTSSSHIDDAVVEACVASAATPGAVTAMVNYYRAMFRGGGAASSSIGWITAIVQMASAASTFSASSGSACRPLLFHATGWSAARRRRVSPLQPLAASISAMPAVGACLS